jgi:uncharacterized membrane protein YdbT with pleckstrin-like domain
VSFVARTRPGVPDRATQKVPAPAQRVIAPVPPPTTLPALGNAFGSDTAGAAVRMPLATLLTGSAVNPGEIVQMVLKPSRWFILLNSMRFAGVVVIAVLGSLVFRIQWFAPTVLVQLAIFLVAGRLMWSTVQWMGRYYLLTDQRLIRVCGVFDVDIQSTPLPEVQSVRLFRPVSERLLNRGSLEIVGGDGLMGWQTITRYKQVFEAVNQAVMKSKQNGCGA